MISYMLDMTLLFFRIMFFVLKMMAKYIVYVLPAAFGYYYLSNIIQGENHPFTGITLLCIILPLTAVIVLMRFAATKIPTIYVSCVLGAMDISSAVVQMSHGFDIHTVYNTFLSCFLETVVLIVIFLLMLDANMRYSFDLLWWHRSFPGCVVAAALYGIFTMILVYYDGAHYWEPYFMDTVGVEEEAFYFWVSMISVMVGMVVCIANVIFQKFYAWERHNGVVAHLPENFFDS
ncbi:MAG: hypothetical protein PUE04_04070 [Lachnospira sp.]|nr:hypothetical protein [Lachnospira sp.]